MTSKHTPGPWQAALERGCHGVIASTLPEGRANFVAIVGNDGDNPEREPERFANARLIAAAPELLEAWVALVGHFELFDREYLSRRLNEKLDAGRAAIAKAKGEA